MRISRSKKNFLYNSFYQLLLIVVPLITTPYLARALGAEGMGLYSYAHAIAGYFVLFIMLGLNNYGNRTIAFVRDDKKKLSRTFCEICRMQITISLVVIALYVLYAIFLSNNPITWVMLIYIVSAAFDINWLFFGLEQFKITVIRSSIIKIISVALIFILVKTQDDVFLYAVINTVGVLASQLILWFYIKKFIVFERVSLGDSLKHLKPDLILFIPVLAISLYKIMDKIMLGGLSDLEQVGFYENTERVIQVPLALITALGTIMMPKISNLAAKKDDWKIRQYMEKSLYFAILIASSMCFGIMAVANDFVPWFYGEGFESCVMLFQILMPSCIFLAIANVVRTQHLIPCKRDKVYIISVIIGAIVNLVVNAILIPTQGAQGAAAGTLLAECGVCLIQLIMIRKDLRIGMILLKSMWYVVAGLIMYGVLQSVPNVSDSNFYNLLVKTILGGVLYIILVLPVMRIQKIFPVSVDYSSNEIPPSDESLNGDV